MHAHYHEPSHTLSVNVSLQLLLAFLQAPPEWLQPRDSPFNI